VAYNPLLVSEPAYLTERELAEYLRLSVETLRNWRKKGQGPPWEEARRGRVRYRAEEVELWLENMRSD
jgi:excisionase family DNA binding protein